MIATLACPDHHAPLVVAGHGVDGGTVIVLCLDGGEEWQLSDVTNVDGRIARQEGGHE